MSRSERVTDRNLSQDLANVHTFRLDVLVDPVCRNELPNRVYRLDNFDAENKKLKMASIA